MEINNKFKIGDFVQVYEEKNVQYSTKKECPLCGGKHKVKNPFYNKIDRINLSTEFFYCRYCNENGELVCYKSERNLNPKLYLIKEVNAIITNDAETYTYTLCSPDNKWDEFYEIKEENICKI